MFETNSQEGGHMSLHSEETRQRLREKLNRNGSNKEVWDRLEARMQAARSRSGRPKGDIQRRRQRVRRGAPIEGNYTVALDEGRLLEG